MRLRSALLLVPFLIAGCGGGSGSRAEGNGELDNVGFIIFSSPTGYNGLRTDSFYEDLELTESEGTTMLVAGGTVDPSNEDRIVRLFLTSTDYTNGRIYDLGGENYFEYRQAGSDLRSWRSTSGTIRINRNAAGQIVFRIQNARLDANDGTAQGQVTVAGSFSVDPPTQ